MQQDGLIHGYTNAIWTGVTTFTLEKPMCKDSHNEIVLLNDDPLR